MEERIEKRKWVEVKFTSFREWLGNQFHNPVFIGLFLLLVVSIVLGIFDLNRFDEDTDKWGADWDGILTEAHGMLMDVFVFGVLFTWFDQLRSRKNEIKNYHNQLEDFKAWVGEEGVLRKVGIIKRLIEAEKVPLNLSSYQLQKANLNKENLRGASFTQADLSNANLNNANLTQADLREVALTQANLRGADLRKAKLSWANLQGADLTKANLHLTNLSWVNLSEAVLIGADFREANLSGGDIRGADPRGLNLQGADLHATDFRGVNLTQTLNLTCLQIKAAKVDRKTKFPDYIKVTWADDDTYTCEMVGDSE